MSVVTIQTLVRNAQKMPENKQALDYLEEYGTIFGQAIRKGYSERNKIGKTDRKARELESFICKQLEENYNLSASEARNAYNKSSAAYDSQAELVDLYIDESSDRIRELRRTLKKLEFKRKKAQDLGQTSTVKNLTKKIHYRQQKINKVEAKIVRLKQSRAEGKFRVTFGSARLFEQQYRLEENGYASHEEWLFDWRTGRSNRSFFIGSKNYQGGNQLVRYDIKKRTLTITVTPTLREKYGNSVTLHDITFPRGEEWLKAAIKQVLRTSTRLGKNSEIREGFECVEQALKKAEGRGQRAEGTSQKGFESPSDLEPLNSCSVGALLPCSLRSRAEDRNQNSLQHSCLLPSAFLGTASQKTESRNV